MPHGAARLKAGAGLSAGQMKMSYWTFDGWPAPFDHCTAFHRTSVKPYEVVRTTDFIPVGRLISCAFDADSIME
jgi:hypothetical protein